MMVDTANPSAPAGLRIQKLAPQDVLDYLAARDIKVEPIFSWQALWQEEYARQFTVSRLTNMDLMQAINDELIKNMQQGQRLVDFQKALIPKLQAAGWWGVKEVLDPETGKKLKTNFNPTRLKLIYDTNMSMANAAGKWARAQQNKEKYPYLVYITQRDERVRKSHAAWEGIALPVDHPFWLTHYPPNGWMCRCYVMFADEKTLSRLEATGIKIKREPPDIVLREHVNKSTGEITQVPVGIDPGFAYNAGIASQAHLLDVARLKLEKVNYDLAAVIIRQLAGSDAFKAWFNAPEGNWPLLRISELDAKSIGSRESVAQLSVDTLVKQKINHADLTVDDYALAQFVVDNHTDKVQDSDNSLVYIWDSKSEQQNGFVLIVKSTRTGNGLFMTSYRKLSRIDADKDRELRRLLGRGR